MPGLSVQIFLKADFGFLKADYSHLKLVVLTCCEQASTRVLEKLILAFPAFLQEFLFSPRIVIVKVAFLTHKAPYLSRKYFFI